MSAHRLRSLVLVLCLGLLGVVSAGCLGQDYKSLSLDLSDHDHGWLALVEPDEDFGVVLHENPQYPGAEWSMIDIDPTVISFVDSFTELPPEGPEDSQVLAVLVSRFKGLAAGESPLRFELVSEGEVVDIAEFTIAVVEDACDGDVGLAAPRCRRQVATAGQYGLTRWEHGQWMDLSSGDDEMFGLISNGLYPDAAWKVVAGDSAVVEVTSLGAKQARASGDWDTADEDKPASFLPVHVFRVTGRNPGEASVAFELVVDDRRIGLCEFTVVVEE